MRILSQWTETHSLISFFYIETLVHQMNIISLSHYPGICVSRFSQRKRKKI